MVASHLGPPGGSAESLIPIHKVPEFRHVSPPTRWRWGLSGQLECVRIGRRLYTTASAVRRFLDRSTVRTPANPPSRHPRVLRTEASAEARRRLGLPPLPPGQRLPEKGGYPPDSGPYAAVGEDGRS